MFNKKKRRKLSDYQMQVIIIRNLFDVGLKTNEEEKKSKTYKFQSCIEQKHTKKTHTHIHTSRQMIRRYTLRYVVRDWQSSSTPLD